MMLLNFFSIIPSIYSEKPVGFLDPRPLAEPCLFGQVSLTASRTSASPRNSGWLPMWTFLTLTWCHKQINSKPLATFINISHCSSNWRKNIQRSLAVTIPSAWFTVRVLCLGVFVSSMICEPEHRFNALPLSSCTCDSHSVKQALNVKTSQCPIDI
jgi:hypothetical protein